MIPRISFSTRSEEIRKINIGDLHRNEVHQKHNIVNVWRGLQSVRGLCTCDAAVATVVRPTTAPPHGCWCWLQFYRQRNVSTCVVTNLWTTGRRDTLRRLYLLLKTWKNSAKFLIAPRYINRKNAKLPACKCLKQERNISFSNFKKAYLVSRYNK